MTRRCAPRVEPESRAELTAKLGAIKAGKVSGAPSGYDNAGKKILDQKLDLGPLPQR